jgi:hypothetical protein
MPDYESIVRLLLFLSNIPPRVIYAFIVQLNRRVWVLSSTRLRGAWFSGWSIWLAWLF